MILLEFAPYLKGRAITGSAFFSIFLAHSIHRTYLIVIKRTVPS